MKNYLLFRTDDYESLDAAIDDGAAYELESDMELIELRNILDVACDCIGCGLLEIEEN